MPGIDLESVFTKRDKRDKRDKSDKIGIMKKENRKSYPSDLTDRQWKEIESLYTGMRRCKWSKRNYSSHLKRAIRFLEEFSFSPAGGRRE